MPDNEFKPYKPEQKMNVIITKREAILLMKLRQYPFGKFVVHKMNNLILRVEVNDSQLIDEDCEITFD